MVQISITSLILGLAVFAVLRWIFLCIQREQRRKYLRSKGWTSFVHYKGYGWDTEESWENEIMITSLKSAYSYQKDLDRVEEYGGRQLDSMDTMLD